MKSTAHLLVMTAAILLLFAGCKKTPSHTEDRYGIGIDWPKLETEFRNNPPAVQAAASSIKRFILYHQFPQAIAALENLATNPTLTEAQKKILTDLRDQTQQAMTKAPPPQAAQ